MKERIREIAGELLSTAAQRALRPGEMLAQDAAYPAFADRFPYQETDDQDRAIGDVLADMASGRPMDGSEEHTSELQSLLRISSPVLCLKKTHKTNTS